MIIFGKIVNTHGLKGEVKIVTSSDFAENRLQKGALLYFQNGESLTVQSAKIHKGSWIVKFKEFDNINQVERYKHADLYVQRDSELLEEDEFLYEDIIGLTLVERDGTAVGTVVDISEVGSNHNLVCKHIETGNRFYIPFVEAFVGDINLEKREITIFPIDGMVQ